jgi:hypothetical protein
VNIPLWVPKPIVAHVHRLLHGEPNDDYGYVTALESAKTRRDSETARYFETEISLLNRLIGIEDDRMKEAYELLSREFTSEEVWQAFVRSIWKARIDYGRIREKLRRAKELGVQIAHKARELAALLNEGGYYSSDWPSELYSVRALLAATDGQDLLWRGLRTHLLGDEDITGETRYIWGTAPSVSECLYVLAEAAQLFQPTETGVIGAALQTRQANVKTEYIRAFGASLVELQVPITPTVMKAMAIAANVAINDEHLDVSLQDVRQALTRAEITQGL